ncbi:MAG: bifunctional 5,10-methylenetetrahydrofolate dehydrogenase/5,10-methenyltetrahydrofolate cyclohydrolase [Holosporaceae bacterium]|jgi:methylenetetrahydrofolate dehydrogenase (NADP+)/methenyltetrahydrofolate cyclohydrolase|nr:bifunctional 5,10-methylenetetrahydrofolate dehydrogenase/5,10-methenyltetrahydrofolate cyclohydrolase [Holosporaceae bacterium]
MTAIVIDGKKISQELCESIAKKIKESRKIIPSIALINASADPASEIYVAKKVRLAESVGIKSSVYKFEGGTDANKIADLIRKLNSDAGVHAILLQSPLERGLNFRNLVDLIDPRKDVDGLTTINQGKLFTGEPDIVPCTPLGIMHLIRSVRQNMTGAHAVVLGRSSIVGKPTSQLLLNENCTVTLLHSRSQNTAEICRTADIVVSAVGRPRYVTRDFIKPRAIVIDVGINRIEIDGAKKIVGDLDFDAVAEVAAAISPVPNGVGPMTVAYLMYNTLQLAQANTA